MNIWRKTLNELFRQIKDHLHIVFILLLAFFACCVFAGLLFFGQRSIAAGRLDKRYDRQYERTAEVIGRLEIELARERDINRQLRNNNTRAREIAGDLTGTAERNVRNLQDAISLISEIRRKLKILADFYTDSNPGDSGS
jgi:hypothetical protein